MIRLMFKQLWNQRRMNGWIFLEIILAGVFLWYTVDSAFVHTAVRMLPKGYTEESRYVIQLDGYMDNHGNFDPSVTLEQRFDAIRRMMTVVRNLPEVESYYIAWQSMRPNSLSWSGAQFFPDTASVAENKYQHAQWFDVYEGEGSDFLYTLGCTDARTGEEMKMGKGASLSKHCYLSETFARNMFGDADPIGQRVYVNKNRDESYVVQGVFKDIKTRDFQLPYCLIVQCTRKLPKSPMIMVRLKEGVDGAKFASDFMTHTALTLKGADLFISDVRSLKELRKEFGVISNAYNQQRLLYSLIAFTLLCIFLGMVGTFWIRINARRQEIGLMRSMGASSRVIMRQFFCESGLLVTLGFLISLVVIANSLMIGEGMAQPLGGFEASANVHYPIFNALPHFIVVTLLCYVLLLGISWVGTYIPVHRAANILPADALRDE